MGAARRAVAGAMLALGLLTILPVRARMDPRGLGAAAAWFPVVGALVGAGAGGVWLAAESLLGATVAGVLAVIWLVVLSGGLHLDGLADCADALGVRGGRERRLAVMRESTIGAFGTLAIVLYALLLTAAAGGLPRDDALLTLVLAGALGRWSAVAHAAAGRPARRDGLGAAFSVTRPAVAIATAAAAFAAFALAGLDGLVALVAAIAVVAAMTAWAHRTLGGRTGDTLGAAIALTELMTVLVLLGLRG
jgi:adenosylcobinamide-GDP ribazoletransferase